MSRPKVTDAMVDAALERARDEASLPYEVRTHHFGSLAGGWTGEQVVALREAEARADRQNRRYMRGVLEAALEARNDRETVRGSRA